MYSYEITIGKYKRKRVFKEKPDCYKCLDLFYEKSPMTVSEMMEAYEKKYNKKLTRLQAHGRIGRLKNTNKLENGGLKVWKLVKKTKSL